MLKGVNIITTTLWGKLMRVKKLFCKHDYIPFANLYGDLINSLGCRTVFWCKKCGKMKFSEEFVPAPVNYNLIVYYMHLQDVMPEEEAWDKVFPDIFSNVRQFKELYIDAMPPHLAKQINTPIDGGIIKFPQDNDAVEDKKSNEV